MTLQFYTLKTNMQNNFPIETRIKIYNMYPGSYQNFEHMIEDLNRIKELGYNAIWLNPIFDCCTVNLINPAKTRCPYAMRDHHKLNPEYGQSLEEVTHFNIKASELGLSPLFDFVARHVAIDHPMVTEPDPELLQKGIDTTKWFKRHPNGNFVIKGMNENYVSESYDPWSDVAEFNYADPKILQEVIEYFWKPFIKFNIEKLKFMGARLDAIHLVPREVYEVTLPYLNELCKHNYRRSAYLVPETIGENAEQNLAVINGLVTHPMNRVFYMPGPEGSKQHSYEYWQQDDNFFERQKAVLKKAGYTVGFVGSHDEERYVATLKKKGIQDTSVLKQRMLEKIMVAAFGSDGGYILTYGDEYGVQRAVNLLQRHVINIKVESIFDLSQSIKEINYLLDKLPSPSSEEWTQRVFLEKHPELVIFIVHPTRNLQKAPYLIVGNILDNEVILNQEMVGEIMQANGRNSTIVESHIPSEIFLCGKMHAHNIKSKVLEVNEKSCAIKLSK